MLQEGVAVDILYRENVPPDQTYELWPQKLYNETWTLLREKQLVGQRLANGDYPFTEQAGLDKRDMG